MGKEIFLGEASLSPHMSGEAGQDRVRARELCVDHDELYCTHRDDVCTRWMEQNVMFFKWIFINFSVFFQTIFMCDGSVVKLKKNKEENSCLFAECCRDDQQIKVQ